MNFGGHGLQLVLIWCCSAILMTIAQVKMREVQLTIDEVIEVMLERTGQQLTGPIDSQQARAGIDVFVTGPGVMSSVRSHRYPTDHAGSATFLGSANLARVFPRPR